MCKWFQAGKKLVSTLLPFPLAPYHTPPRRTCQGTSRMPIQWKMPTRFAVRGRGVQNCALAYGNSHYKPARTSPNVFCFVLGPQLSVSEWMNVEWNLTTGVAFFRGTRLLGCLVCAWCGTHTISLSGSTVFSSEGSVIYTVLQTLLVQWQQLLQNFHINALGCWEGSHKSVHWAAGATWAECCCCLRECLGKSPHRRVCQCFSQDSFNKAPLS